MSGVYTALSEIAAQHRIGFRRFAIAWSTREQRVMGFLLIGAAYKRCRKCLDTSGKE